MSKQPTPKQYSGALSSRLKYRGGEFPTDLINEYCALPPTISRHFKDEVEAEIDAACIDYTKERLAKLPALFAHYGISEKAPDRWFKLARSLAIAHVPGFQVENRKGRKLRQPRLHFDLWAKVKLMQIDGDHNVSQACALLWKRNGKKGTSADLRRRFTAANKVFGTLYKNLPLDIMKRDLLIYQSKLLKRAAVKRLKQ